MTTGFAGSVDQDGCEAERTPARAASAAPSFAGGLWRALPFISVTLVSGALSTYYYRQGWAAPTHSWSAATGDPEQTMWFLAWVPYALLHGHGGLLSTYQLFPQGENLMWNTSVVLPSILLAPVTLLAGPVVSYNLLLTLSPVATASAGYVAFARYVRKGPAVIGGLAFAFCPFVVHQQFGHQQVSLVALVPLTLLLLDEMLVRQRWRWWVSGGLLGVTAAAQLLTGEEILTIEALMAVVGVATLVALNHQQVALRARYALRALSLATGSFVVLASYPLFIQFFGPQRAKPTHSPATFETDLVNFVQPILQVIKLGVVRAVAFTGNPVEWTGYLGFPLLAVIALVVVRDWRRRPVVPVAAIGLAVFAILTLGPQLHVNGRVVFSPMPWAALAHLPVLSGLLPARLFVAVDLFACLLLAVFVDDLVGAARWSFRIAGTALVAAVACFWLPVAPPVTTIVLPSFFTTAAKDAVPAGSVAVVTPYIFGPSSEDAVIWQGASGMRYRMVDGWMIVPSSHMGPASMLTGTLSRLERQVVPMTAQRRHGIMAALHEDGAQVVIVGPGPGEGRTVRFFADLFGRGPQVRTGGVSVFRVPPS